MSEIVDASDQNRTPAFDTQSFAGLVTAAREGSLAAQGRLLEAFRHDLLAIAAANLDSDIRPKVSASDLVQETLLEAHQDFGDFRGATWHEARAWLKRILLHNLVNHFRHWSAQKRRAAREIALDESESQSPRPLVDREPTASDVASGREQRARLDEALQLLKDDYRQVLELRHREGLTFDEIGVRMNRTTDAVRMLWYRAFDELSRRLQ